MSSEIKDWDYHADFASVGEQNASFNVSDEEILVWVPH